MAKEKKDPKLPFEDLREFIQTECIGSRAQYVEWHKANKPKQIPRYPNRAYGDEWTDWNDFLGNDNEFDNTKKKWRPLSEATAWVHKLELGGEKEWLKYVRANRSSIPEDIPNRPDIVYDDWRSWMHWLGNRTPQKVEAQQEVIRSSTIFYIIQEREYADRNNVFTFGVDRGGVSGLRDQWEMSKNFRVIRMFEFDDKKMETVQKIIHDNTTGYYGADTVRIVPNINEIIWEISNHLEFAQIR